MVHATLVFPCEPKVNKLDILVLVEDDVLELEVAMDAGLLMNVVYGTHKLRKDLLHLGDWERTLFEEVIIQLIA